MSGTDLGRITSAPTDAELYAAKSSATTSSDIGSYLFAVAQ